VCACGAYVRSLLGDVVSIAAVVTKEHWDENREHIVASVIRARDAAQAALGSPLALD